MRLIDADEFEEWLIMAQRNTEESAAEDAIDLGVEPSEIDTTLYFSTQSFIDTMRCRPTINAVEVVRCKDCDAASPSPFRHPHLRWCKILGDHCTLDFYCGFGKRKENAR